MGMLEEAQAEIMERAKRAGGKDAKPEPMRRRKEKRDMTKEEREAYIQKKMAEEEARLLKKARGAEPVKRKRKVFAPKPQVQQKEVTDKPERAGRKRPQKEKGALLPLQPLRPLHLLKIPGLPEGDFLAICYVRGTAT